MKRKKSNKFAVSNTTAAPAATVIEKTSTVEEAKTEATPVAAESAPAVEAPAAEVKESKPTAKKKPAAKKEEIEKNDVFLIQSNGKDYTNDDIVELCKAAYRNGTRKHIKSCDVYVKAENDGLRAYYVINGNADGAFIEL